MSVPRFARYFPATRDFRSRAQREFYAELAAHLERGDYLDVAGNISYVFIYLYALISRLCRDDPPHLSEELLRIGEMYAHEPQVTDHCRSWAADCLLAQERFDQYLEKTEPASAVGTETHVANVRLNVQRWSGREAHPIDVLRTSGRNRISRVIRDNEGLYREKAEVILAAHAAQHGGWFALFGSWGVGVERHAHTVFAGSPYGTRYHRQIACFYGAPELDVVAGLARAAEDAVRSDLGLPGVGEGWIAETDLYRRIKDAFPETPVVHHGSPDWLGRQHFDVWLPHWRIAVEYQGLQHYEPVAIFGGVEGFEKTLERDRRKADAAARAGVLLILARDTDEPAAVITRIRAERERQLGDLYRDARAATVDTTPKRFG